MASFAQTAQKPGPLARARRWAAGFKERDTWVAYGFLLPWFIGFAVFIAGPMIASLVLSFTDYSVIQSTNWVGTQNYQDLVHDPKVVLAMKNSLVFTLMSVPLEMISALLLALILLHIGRAAGFFRTIFYLPKMTPPVAVAILYLLLFNGAVGIVNKVLGWFHIPARSGRRTRTWVKPGLVLMSAWAVGGTMVIYLAALRGVPQHLYEAAAMDGAGPWRRFRDVTLPMISPALFFTFIILTIAGLTEFTKAYTAFFGAGTKTNQTEAALFYAVYLFRQSFEFFHFGYASALAWLLFVVILMITFVQVRVSKRFVFYQGDAARMSQLEAVQMRRARCRCRRSRRNGGGGGVRLGTLKSAVFAVVLVALLDPLRLPVHLGGQRVAEASGRRLRQPADPEALGVSQLRRRRSTSRTRRCSRGSSTASGSARSARSRSRSRAR